MNIIPFGSGNLPAFAKSSGAGSIVAALAHTFDSISIKGKVFPIKNKTGKTLVTKPDTEEPAAAIEVVILDRSYQTRHPCFFGDRFARF